jgi:hypothetical protein
MLTETFTLTTNDVSTDHKVVLIDSSAKYFATVFASDMNIPYELLRIKDVRADSFEIQRNPHSAAYLTMLASESMLSRDWDQPEEDEAWMDL